MSELQPHDFSVAPLYLLRARPPLHQSVLLHLWCNALCGKQWTLKSIAQEAGTTGGSVKKVLEACVGEGVVIEVSAKERANSKASSAYKVNCEFVPERKEVAKPPAPPKPKVEFPDWVWKMREVWEPIGVIGPKAIHAPLCDAVARYGAPQVAVALCEYVRTHDHTFSSPKNFAAHICEYMPRKESTRPQAAQW